MLANYNFTAQLRAINFSMDRDIVGQANVRLPLRTSAGSTSLLKVGAKFRDKSEGPRPERNHRTRPPTTLKLTNYLETGFDLPPYLDGRYDLTPYTSQSAGREHSEQCAVHRRQQPRARCREVRRHRADGGRLRDGGNLRRAEAVPAAGPSLRAHDATISSAATSGSRRTATWLGTDPIGSQGELRRRRCPAFHLRYAATPNTNLRFAVTRIAGASELLRRHPDRSQDDNALTVVVGNADLRPTTSWNVDVLAEHYFKSVGVVSAGVFYKHLTDYIYIYTLQQPINGVQYQVTQPLNGDSATLRGLEVALQNQLRFLPSPFNGIGVYANYTFTDSTAQFPQHRATARCPGNRDTSATSRRRTRSAGSAAACR